MSGPSGAPATGVAFPPILGQAAAAEDASTAAALITIKSNSAGQTHVIPIAAHPMVPHMVHAPPLSFPFPHTLLPSPSMPMPHQFTAFAGGPFVPPLPYAPPVPAEYMLSSSMSSASFVSDASLSGSRSHLPPSHGPSSAPSHQSSRVVVGPSTHRSNTKRSKTKEDVLVDQLAATEEIGRKRSARVEALKRASEEESEAARAQAAVANARKKATLEKAKQERAARAAAEQEQQAMEAARAAADLKQRVADVRARHALKAAAAEERQAREAADAQAESERKAHEQEERRKRKETALLSREAARTQKKAAEAQAAAAADAAKAELDAAEAERRTREKRLIDLERSKSHSIAAAEAKLVALQASIASAERSRSALVADTERKRREANDADAAATRAHERQKEERMRMEIEAKLKRKMEWSARRSAAAAAASATAATPPTAPVPPARRPVASPVALSAPRRRASPTIPSRSRPAARAVPAAASKQVPASSSPLAWTPTMAREAAERWNFLFQTYGSFLPAERATPCIAALMSARAHPRDAVDFTHQELHEMSVRDWRTRKDILDVMRVYLRQVQHAYMHHHDTRTGFFDERGDAVNAASVQHILNDRIARDAAAAAADGGIAAPPLATATSTRTLSSTSSTPVPSFDPLVRPSSSLGVYSGPLFDAVGAPVDLADLAATFLQQQMEAAKTSAVMSKTVEAAGEPSLTQKEELPHADAAETNTSTNAVVSEATVDRPNTAPSNEAVVTVHSPHTHRDGASSRPASSSASNAAAPVASPEASPRASPRVKKYSVTIGRQRKPKAESHMEDDTARDSSSTVDQSQAETTTATATNGSTASESPLTESESNNSSQSKTSSPMGHQHNTSPVETGVAAPVVLAAPMRAMPSSSPRRSGIPTYSRASPTTHSSALTDAAAPLPTRILVPMPPQAGKVYRLFGKTKSEPAAAATADTTVPTGDESQTASDRSSAAPPGQVSDASAQHGIELDAN